MRATVPYTVGLLGGASGGQHTRIGPGDPCRLQVEAMREDGAVFRSRVLTLMLLNC
jgi:hypothetical protein